MDTEEKYFVKLGGKIIAGVIILLIIIVYFPLFVVSAGERGIVLRWGKVDRVMTEGIHLVIPIAEDVTKLDVKTQKEEVKADSASKDLQIVSTVIALNYHLDSERVGSLWSAIGSEYKTRIIDPAIQEAVKAATAKYTAEELITKRAEVKDTIKISLSERLLKEYIIVDELSIVNFDFSQSFNQAIEAKVTAQQEALTAQNRLEQFKFEAEQKIAKAKGDSESRILNAKAEAEAIKIQAQAITQQGGKDYVQLKAIEKWSGNLPNQMIPGGAIPFIDLAR